MLFKSISLTVILKKVIYGDGMNPLPAKVVAPLFILMLFNAMTMTMVFAFLPQMVKSFGINEVKTGVYAGMIASSLFVGRTLCSFFWGYLADIKGKKICLLVASTSLMLATLVFGFSRSFTWALVTRFLEGCSMGIVVIAKSILSDKCDDSNSALAMAFLATATSTGLVLGPSIGGFLAFPGELYPKIFVPGSLFDRFGVLLVSLIVVAGFVLGIALSIYFLPQDIKKQDQYDSEKTLLIPLKLKEGSTTKNYYYSIYDVEEYVTLHSVDKNQVRPKSFMEENYANMEILQIIEPILEINSTDRSCCCSKKGCKNSKLGILLRTKECILVSILYGTYSICATGFDELFPLYAATVKKYNGYGFKTSEIGSALLVAAAVLVLLQITVIARVAKRFGPRKVFVWSTMAQATCYLFIPLIRNIQDRYRKVFWVLMLIVLFVVRTGIVSSYLTINVLLNNSAEPKLLGSVNGLGMTFASFGRTIAPSLIGSIYSWSMNNVRKTSGNVGAGFPLNEYFAFLVLTLVATGNSIFASFLPKHMDRRKAAKESSKAENASRKSKRNIKNTYVTVSTFKPNVH